MAKKTTKPSMHKMPNGMMMKDSEMMMGKMDKGVAGKKKGMDKKGGKR